MLRHLKLAVFLALFLAIFTQLPRVSAAEDVDLDDEIEEGIEEEEEPLNTKQVHGKLVAHPLVETFVHFPSFPNLTTGKSDWTLPQGEDILMLVGVSNQSPDLYFNVSYIGAHLHSFYDASHYIYNFTVKENDAVVGPGQETTVEYRFLIDPNLEPIDFIISSWVVYNSSRGQTYQSTVMNETVLLIEKIEPWTISSAVQYLTVLGGLGAIVFVSFKYLSQNPSSKKKRAKRAAPTAEEKQEVAKSWETVVYKQADKAKVVRRAGSSKKGSKKSDKDEEKSGSQKQKKGSKKTASNKSE